MESLISSPVVAIVSVASAAAALFATYYSVFVTEKPRVYANSGKLRKFLDGHVKSLKRTFRPSPFLIEGRLQTIFSLSQRITTPAKLPYSREILTLEDGGEVALDFMPAEPGSTNKAEKPFLVVFLPGLTSSSHTSYVRCLVQKLNQIGASVIVFNNRGNGGVPFKTPKTYSATYIGDLIEVIDFVKHKYPNHRLIGLGTSMGGMVLSKYLISKPVEARQTFECAILISIVWDCVRGSANLEKPYINLHLINKALVGGLKKLGKKFLTKFEDVKLNFDYEGAITAKTVREFDAAFTAPQFGYSSVEEYYDDATTCGKVHQFPIPVFGISAEDDPIQPGHLIPTDEALAEKSKLALIVTKRGGHLGWLEGFGKRSEHYIEKVAGELVEGIRLFGKEELIGV